MTCIFNEPYLIMVTMLTFYIKIILLKIHCRFSSSDQIEAVCLALCHLSLMLLLWSIKPIRISTLYYCYLTFITTVKLVNFLVSTSLICRVACFSHLWEPFIWIKTVFSFSYILKVNNDIHGFIFVFLCQKIQFILLTCAEHTLCQHLDTVVSDPFTR